MEFSFKVKNFILKFFEFHTEIEMKMCQNLITIFQKNTR